MCRTETGKKKTSGKRGKKFGGGQFGEKPRGSCRRGEGDRGKEKKGNRIENVDRGLEQLPKCFGGRGLDQVGRGTGGQLKTTQEGEGDR